MDYIEASFEEEKPNAPPYIEQKLSLGEFPPDWDLQLSTKDAWPRNSFA